MKQFMYAIIYIFIESCQISTQNYNTVQYIYSVYADRDHLELVLILIVC